MPASSISALSAAKSGSAVSVLSHDQAALVDEVKVLHAGVRKSYEHQIQYAFMAGLKLQALKDSCPHGNSTAANGEGFRSLCSQFLPDLGRESVTRYLDFTKLLQEKIPTVCIIRSSNLLLENGELPEKEKTAVIKAVYEASDGKTWTAFYRDLKLCRDKQPKQHHPIKELSPDEQIEAEKHEAAERRDAFIQELTILAAEIASKSCNPVLDWTTPTEWKEILRRTRTLSKLIAPLTKRRENKSSSSSSSNSLAGLFRGQVAEDRLRELCAMTAAQLRQVLAMPKVQKAVHEKADYHLAKLLERYRVEHYQGTTSNFWRVKQAPSWITVAKLPNRDACLAYLADHGCDENGNLLKDPS